MGKIVKVCDGWGKLEMDSLKRSRELAWGDDDCGRGLAVLEEAQRHWRNMWQFRVDRERNKRYHYGDQWGDLVCVDGRVMTEGEYIRRKGKVPLKQNLIRRLVRNVIGVYREQVTEPTCYARDRNEQQIAETMSTLLQYNMQKNGLEGRYARSMEEFLISGLVVHRKWWGRVGDEEDCWTDIVEPKSFFMDTNVRDYRGRDVSIIGEIHDTSFDELTSEFARDPKDYQRLAEIYAGTHDGRNVETWWNSFGYSDPERDCDFLVPRDRSRCRVVEVWRKESKPRYWCHDYMSGEVYKIETEDLREMVEEENARRLRQAADAGMDASEVPLIEAKWYIDTYWYCYYLSPMGHILREFETPYAHKSHPYVFCAYPFIDGEIHSFVADVIDQQRYTNRLITMYDWIIGASAKGVLMIPQDCIPTGMTPEQFADTWDRIDGVIVYKPSTSGKMPTQIAANSTPVGIQELLNLQLKFFEDISGVNGALQGKPGYSGMSAALYNQQTQNATTSLVDLLDTFNEFKREAALKDVSNIQQFYDGKMVEEIVGGNGAEMMAKLGDVEFDLSIVPSTTTPAYRAVTNDLLMSMWEKGAITTEQLLEVGNFPFGDALLQNMKAEKERQAREQEEQQARMGAQAEQAPQGQAQGPSVKDEG
ncbi:MAG: hypothetical protein LIO91_02950 [Bacteroidales bacterium]|nr:hypothetical protein [Bacteroidales bacterium]